MRILEEEDGMLGKGAEGSSDRGRCIGSATEKSSYGTGDASGAGTSNIRSVINTPDLYSESLFGHNGKRREVASSISYL